MNPHQEIMVDIAYASRGMDFFYYRVPNQRYINDFEFALTIDRLPTTLLNYPDGVLTPTDIQATSDGNGSILTWRLDQAITTAGMGVALIQPEQPGEKVLRVLVNSPFALTMLGAMLALTLLILGVPVNLLDLALLSGVHSHQLRSRPPMKPLYKERTISGSRGNNVAGNSGSSSGPTSLEVVVNHAGVVMLMMKVRSNPV